MARNPEFVHAEAMAEIANIKTRWPRARAGSEGQEEAVERDKHLSQKQSAEEGKPNVSSYDELFPSRAYDHGMVQQEVAAESTSKPDTSTSPNDELFPSRHLHRGDTQTSSPEKLRPKISSHDELFLSRRPVAPKTTQGEEPVQMPRPHTLEEVFPFPLHSTPRTETAPSPPSALSHHAARRPRKQAEGRIANTTTSAEKRRAIYADHRLSAADTTEAEAYLTRIEGPEVPEPAYTASALKHFRNQQEKRETDRVSEAGSYNEQRVVDPVVNRAEEGEKMLRRVRIRDGKGWEGKRR